MLLAESVKSDIISNWPIYHIHYSNRGMHICKLKYKEICAYINELDLNTSQIYLIMLGFSKYGQTKILFQYFDGVCTDQHISCIPILSRVLIICKYHWRLRFVIRKTHLEDDVPYQFGSVGCGLKTKGWCGSLLQ